MNNDESKTPHILIVGGSGFIGQHIVRRALDLGWQVTSIGLTLPENQSDESTNLNYVEADITDRNSLQEVLSGVSFEFVVNCGGYIDHLLFKHGGRKSIDAHFLGVLNLIEILNRDLLKAFINIGSSDEYGNLPAPQKESLREASISPYSQAKVATTHFLQMLWRTEKFPATILRLYLTYGPGQDPKRFLPQIIQGCNEGLKFPTSKGEQIRDFCFIRDVVDAIFITFYSTQARGEVINIASGIPISIRTVIDKTVHIIGKGEAGYGEIPYRIGENMTLYADVSKAKSILGWSPKVSFDEGLQNTIRWYRDV